MDARHPRLPALYGLLVLSVLPGTAWPADEGAALRTRLETVASRALPSEADGAAVMDLTTGEVVLLHHPEVLAHAYPPGSLLKLVSAYAARLGDSGLRETVRCSGRAIVNDRPLTCWDASGHGEVDLTRALATSCNLFFHQLGTKLDPERFLQAARAFGLGRAVGVSIPGEQAGSVPSALSRAELVELSAGVGTSLTATPLQLLQIAGTLAKRGQAPRPRLAGQADARPGLRLANTPAIDRLREGMRQAAETGTLSATRLGLLEGAGKTGTAPWAEGFRTHAWFIGFAPYSSPRYAVVVFAQEGRGAVSAAQPGVELLAAALGAPWAEVAQAKSDDRLRVRVLGKHHPKQARLESEEGVLRCDGRPLELKAANFDIEMGLLDLGRPSLRCRVLEAPGEGVRVKLRGVERRYRGSMRAEVKDGEIAFLNLVEPEDYLRGVIGSELTEASLEALKAQAVVSRTWALASRGRHEEFGYDLCDLTHCQVYRGRSGESVVTDRAVAQTRGQVLRFRGALLATSFHSTCGGKTSSSSAVFGGDSPLPGIADTDRGAKGPLCQGSPHFEWTWRVSRRALARALGVPAEGPAFEVLERDGAGRVLKLRSFGVPLTGQEFHARVGRNLGYHTLKSLKVLVDEAAGQVRFRGHGLGHGVGLCQHGAVELGRRGVDYRRILEHYFPGGALGDVAL